MTIEAFLFTSIALSANLDTQMPVFDALRPFVFAEAVDGIQFSFDAFPDAPRDNIVRLTMRPDDHGDYWFELLHILPRFREFGNVLTAVQQPIEIYNANRLVARSVTSFTNPAGEGTDIIDLPSLPTSIGPQRSLFLTLELLPSGAPTVDAVLVFGTNAEDLLFPLTATRLVVFGFAPERPLTEVLKFLTEVFVHKNGTEQRVSLRSFPRQEFALSLELEEGDDLSRLDFLMFEWQSRVFGVPVWTEATRLTAAATAGDLTVTVGSTAFADYRVGSLGVVWLDERTLDALEVESFTATTITFRSPIALDYPVGTRVMPMRTAAAGSEIQGGRRLVNLASRRVTFRVVNNAVLDAFPDATPFVASGGVLDGEIVVDSIPLGSGGQIREAFDRRMQVFDNGTGKFSQTSVVPHNQRAFSFEVSVKSREALWRLRRLLYALRGRQAHFWLPTYYRDLRLTAVWTNATSTLSVANVGYSKYALQRGRYKYLRMRLSDGTVLDRQVTASAEIDAADEQLTVNAAAPRNITPDEVVSIQFLERVRLDRDEIKIVHIDETGQATVQLPVREEMV